MADSARALVQHVAGVTPNEFVKFMFEVQFNSVSSPRPSSAVFAANWRWHRRALHTRLLRGDDFEVMALRMTPVSRVIARLTQGIPGANQAAVLKATDLLVLPHVCTRAMPPSLIHELAALAASAA